MAKQGSYHQSNGAIILDQFSDASLRQWNRLSALLEEYNVKLFYYLESLRKLHHGQLCDALLNQKSVSVSTSDWWRIVDHKYSNSPLSSIGSLKAGGRFNIGNNLSTSGFKPFPALYIAENEDTAYNEKFGQTPAANGLTGNDLALRASSSYAAIRLRIDINNVFDLCNANNLIRFTKIISQFQLTSELKELAKQIGIKPPYLISDASRLKKILLANDWRYYPVQHDIPSNSQLFGRMLRDAGFEGVIYPSTKLQNRRNIAIFSENLEKSSSYVTLQDPAPDTINFTTLDATNWRKLSE